MSDTPPYPAYVCASCGTRHGRAACGIACWHVGTCNVCGITTSVTEPRDFGHLKPTWIAASADKRESAT